MLRTEYYDSNRIRLTIERMISTGVIDAEKEADRLPSDEDADIYYREIPKYIKSFLGRFQCAIDAVTFFEQFMDIHNEIVAATKDPDNASLPAAMLASTEFGRVIMECDSPLDIISKELNFQQEDFERRQAENKMNDTMMPYNPYSVYGKLMPPIPANPFSIENYGKPFAK